MVKDQADVNYHDLDRAALIAMIEARDMTVAALLEAISKMKRQINAFNKKVFGSTSEKQSVVFPREREKDYVDFVDVVPEVNDGLPQQASQQETEQREPEGEERPKRVYTTPHPGRSNFPESLERRPKYILLDGSASNTDHKELCWSISERLVMNLDIYVEQTHRQVKTDGCGNKLIAAYPSDDPYYKHKLTSESVALMLMMRFNLHVPCYRLHQLLPKHTIGYNTMVEATGKAYEELKVLGPVLLSEVKKGAQRLGIDEVPYDSLDTPDKIEQFKEKTNMLGWANAGQCPVSDDSRQPSRNVTDNTSLDNIPGKAGKTGKKKEIHTGRLWVLINEEAAMVYYFFCLTRAKNIAEWLLGDYDGLVISDAYAAYLNIANNKSLRIILMLCWAHARRRFTDLVIQGKTTDPVIIEVIRRIGKLYEIEKRIKGKSDQEILAARVGSTQLLEQLKTYLEEKRRLYTPKEAVAEAIDYLLNHWNFFIEYTKHAKGVLDNNACERTVKPVTINRKNGLFFGSVKHGEGAALMLSLAQNCKIRDINFMVWAADVLKRIRSHPKDRLDELLPHKWEPLGAETLTTPSG